jgi:helicase MOV-10
LAGDPYQLGPVVTSVEAKNLGLEISPLERLVQNHIYKRKQGSRDSAFITKLQRNYRSHPDLIKVPSQLFYDDELEAHSNHSTTHKLLSFESLPNKEFPMIIHHTKGTDSTCETTSIANDKEAELVQDYAKQLLEHGLPADHIGIISPYARQVRQIRKKLHNKNITIGTVETFQGQEREAIIISTVRSTLIGKPPTIGFLRNPKRFNVSVTRSKALLILVCDVELLSQDPNWNTLIRFARDNQAIINDPGQSGSGPN